MSQSWSSKKDVAYTLLEQADPPAYAVNVKQSRSGLYKVSIAVLVILAVCASVVTSLLAYNMVSEMLNKSDGVANLAAAHTPDKTVNIVNVDSMYVQMQNKSPKNALPAFVNPKARVGAPQCTVPDDSRFDCWPEYKDATEDKCQKRGCCWEPAQTQGAPWCYFPSNYPSYTASNIQRTSSGVSADLSRSGATFFPPDVRSLKLQIDYQTESRLRIKIFDPNNARFEPPVGLPQEAKAISNPEFNVTVTSSPFNIIVTRASNGATVFDTTGQAPFIFADQFMQIGTKLSTPFLYGLGEHRHNFLQEVTDWRKLVFWNRDSPPSVNNGYGTHPFFLNLEPNTGGTQVSKAHGVLLLNSNAGDVAIQPVNKTGGITYRYTGGLFDFYVLVGDSPLSVSAQYSQLVGPSYMPPFWFLGYNLCKWGYNSSRILNSVIQRNRAAQIPYDVQWNDIDYMDKYKDWTYSPDRYGDLPSIVQDLHSNKQRYIIMADPAISSSQPAGSYPPFDDGKKLGVFVQNAKGGILIGSVWPGATAFPDFFHPKAHDYWYKQAKDFHDKIPFDGLWIDMNEPSSFNDGSQAGCDQSSKYMNPPFVPGTIDGGSLVSKTICPSAKHFLSSHYNLHNMYGWSQANVSRGALNSLYGNKRSPIISRSTFVTSGRYTGHWLGDNFSQYGDLAYSIAGILNFNLFGIPLIGADICGFLGNTNPELCTRWTQLGIFYPFMRNHGDIHSNDQDPGSFQSPWVDYMRKSIQTRYQLLAVLYTAFFNANTKGLPIVRPLFYTYPGTETVAHQFMWNDQLLVSPVVSQGATSVQAVIPKDTFYDFYTGAPVYGQGTTITLNAPIDTINIHIRGGSILPLLPTTQRTDDARQSKFNIMVAPSPTGTASGELFWDDGESADSIPAKKYSLVQFNLNQNTLKMRAAMSGYTPPSGLTAGQVTVLGVNASPASVTVNGVTSNFQYDAQNKVLKVLNLSVNLLQEATVTWS